MTTKYISFGFDLANKSGQRLRIGFDEETFELEDELHIKGFPNQDGSIRFAIDDNTGIGIIQERIAGLWQPTSFKTGPKSILLGERISISATGHYLSIEDVDGHSHLFAHSRLIDGLSISDTKILNAYLFTERVIFQANNAGVWVGSNLEFTIFSADYILADSAYYQTDSVAATQPIRYQIWEGVDDTGTKIFDQIYPASEFPANTEIKITTAGSLEFEEGLTFFHRLNSTANFSLKTNVAQDTPWIAADISNVREDDLLQLIAWKSGESFIIGQWVIYENKIYVCNTDGVQSGVFTDNLIYWDILGIHRVNIGSLLVSGNTASTIISTKDVFVDLNLGGLAVAASDIEQWTLTNTTTGELRYDGVVPVYLQYKGLIAAFSAGGTQRFNFRLLRNDAPLDPPDDVDIPLEIRANIASSPLLWSIIIDPGDLFRLQVANADGVSNITIDTLKVTIS